MEIESGIGLPLRRFFPLLNKLPNLSKSRFISGSQCYLRLWYEVHAKDLATDPGTSLQAVFEAGHEVGELAHRCYPGGHFVAHDHFHIPDALAETSRLLKQGTVSSIFEGAVEYQGLLTRADIIERLPSGGWRLIEVKSSTRVKDVFVLDAAFQLHVLRGAGLDVHDVAVMTLDRSYVYDGNELDLTGLFKLHGVMDLCEELLATIGKEAREMQAIISESDPPSIQTGDHCFAPYECPYYEHCSRDDIVPDHGIDELPSLYQDRRAQLKEAGIKEVRDIPEEFPLSNLQRLVRQSVKNQKPVVHGDITFLLSDLTPPVRYLDFETFAHPIPRFAGTSPYDAIPFLFSVHTKRNSKTVTQTDYLHEQDHDPRPHIVEQLIKAVGSEGSICTYSHYERTVLNSLIKAVPDRADELDAISARLFDLLRAVKHTIYHPEFRGSFSIKSVLPVLVPGMGYGDLDISDGQTASILYTQALRNRDHRERERTFHDLRAYCERDTLAMVRLHDVLREL